MAAYETKRTILFEHCDPAGIVFFPRYFEMLNGVAEEWFDKAHGINFRVLHEDMRRGIPTVSMNDISFKAPSRLSETVTFRYGVKALGNASLTIHFEIVGEDDVLRVSGDQTIVFVDMDKMKPVPFPDDLRASIEKYKI